MEIEKKLTRWRLILGTESEERLNGMGAAELLDEEILENLEPDIGLAAAILTLKDQIPKASKESARRFIEKIVEEVNRLLEQEIRGRRKQGSTASQTERDEGVAGDSNLPACIG